MADSNLTSNDRWQVLPALALVFVWLSIPAEAQLLTGLESAFSPTLSSRIDSARADFEHLMAENQFEEAAAAAKLTISLLLQDPNHDKLVYAEALTQLATAQHNAEAFDTAIENYELAIDVIIAERDRLSGELVSPMLGLSRASQASGRYIEAVKSYKQTLHVYQVSSGLYGDEKGQITAELSESYFALGNFSKANAMQDSYVSIIARDNPGDDVARLPSMYSRADMLTRTGSTYRALEGYRRIIALIEHAEGTQSLRLLPAFIAISKLLVEHEIIDGDDGVAKARRFMRRAVDIAEKNEAADTALKAKAYIMMGDFLSLQSANRRSVIRSYRRGWHELGKDEHLLAERDTLFSGPTLLNHIPVKTPSAMHDLLRNADEPAVTKNGVVIVRYDVSEYGRPENVRIVEAVPPEIYDYMVRNHVRNFAFRPRFVDGEPVMSPDRLFELRFSFRDEDLPEKVRQNMENVAAVEAAL